MPSSHLILCHPLLLLPPIPPSIKVFSNESTLRMRWPKYWSFSFSIIPSKEIPGLISFRMDWVDLLAVQGTLKSLLQHHSRKASMFRHLAFFPVQLSHPYMTTGKTIAYKSSHAPPTISISLERRWCRLGHFWDARLLFAHGLLFEGRGRKAKAVILLFRAEQHSHEGHLGFARLNLL